ncbi:hypothetical protein Tco_1069469 [Tanacetum coccineum]|uniref:Uncharacterized protein n=1 Tax=Tanacetum coccineum TaxID=301880 RepID=A0ABQ5HIK7_9ASTR
MIHGRASLGASKPRRLTVVHSGFTHPSVGVRSWLNLAGLSLRRCDYEENRVITSKLSLYTVLVSTINDAGQGSADVAYRTPLAPYEKSKFLGFGGSMVARLKLKGINRRAPPGVEPAAEFSSTRGNLHGLDIVRNDRLRALS